MTNADNFRNFLMENGAYEGYCRAVKQQTGRSFDEVSDGRHGFHGLIDKSFAWASTNEPGNYWSDLNKVWNSAYNNGKVFTGGYRSIW